jgi:DNA-directed RNA polymerase I subunit RPA2
LLVYMIQKLFQLVQNKAKMEGVDCVMMQELLLGGHLYQQYVKEKLDLLLSSIRINIDKKIANNGLSNGLNFEEMQQIVKYCSTLERNLESFLATGNIISPTGLGLMQNAGLVIIAENINRMRYMSHFRAVHRGSYFVTMRTTESRALLPDAWGFICPVHTPDGSPCGLLNHLSIDCVASKHPNAKKVEIIPKLLVNLGMVPINTSTLDSTRNMYVCMLDGKILGYITENNITRSVDKLRQLKIEGEQLPHMTEVVLVPKKEGGQAAGLYLFTSSARMMRPVMNLAANKIEWIGTFEQVSFPESFFNHNYFFDD